MNDKVEKDKANEKGDDKSNDKAEKDKANEKADDKSNDRVEKGKSKFDWVTERSACSLPKVFKELRLQVEEDVKTRNALRPENSPYEFSVVAKGSDFTVFLIAKDVRRSVTFSLAEHAISVRDGDGSPVFDVTLTFNDAGECRLKVKEQERELWQVRRMALEELMFRGN